MKQATRIRKRSGFTLVELIVVLMILAGLATILIPGVTDMVARTNASSSAANIAEVSNAIQRYEATYFAYPDNLDSMKSALGVGTDLTTLSADLLADTVNVTVTTALRVPLTNAGLTSVGVHGTTDDTFVLATATSLSDDDVLLGLETAKQVSLGLETIGVANKYILLGVGALSEMNGTVTIDAPVYFPEDGTLNPDTIYGRYIAVFQITDGTDPLTRARFVTVLTAIGDGLSEKLSDYFNVTLQN